MKQIVIDLNSVKGNKEDLLLKSLSSDLSTVEAHTLMQTMQTFKTYLSLSSSGKALLTSITLNIKESSDGTENSSVPPKKKGSLLSQVGDTIP
jgi:hypothetical protein